MKISAKSEYACMAVLELALQYEKKEPVQIQSIAEKQKIPMKFLVQILNQLKQSRLIRSKRGAQGGYFLTKPPSRITLGEVIRIIEGPLMSLNCLDKDLGNSCLRERECGLKNIWKEIKEELNQRLDKITFEEICNRQKEVEQAIYYI